ncbi:MAG: YesL family protein [Acetatifactor sp.]|nr:YesL family protein [Acetatifactor sp.]
MKLFDLDSPLMQGLTKFANLMLLNFLTIIFCIPVFTAGAAITALHYVVLKMVRDEDCYIIKDYFKSFKTNFKQGTILWLISLVAIAVLGADFYILRNMESATYVKVLQVIITVIALFVLFTLTFLFPTLAKFDNPTLRTIRNALTISILQFPKTILMIILNAVPIVIILASVRLLPFVFFFGFSAPAYAGAFLYSKFFKRLEDQILAANEENNAGEEETSEDERIFHDELDPSLSADDTVK